MYINIYIYVYIVYIYIYVYIQLPARVLHWDPRVTDETAHRARGLPVVRREDDLIRLADEHFPGRQWFDVAANPAGWNAK